jgi:hypothetical protein
VVGLLVFGSAFAALISWDVSDAAERYLAAQPRVRELVGDDLRLGWVAGTIGQEWARIEVPVKGRAGKITARLELEKSPGSPWNVVAASCETADGTVADLLARPGQAPLSAGR